MRHLIERDKPVPAGVRAIAGPRQETVPTLSSRQLADELVAGRAVHVGVEHVQREERPVGERTAELLERADVAAGS